MKLGESGTDGNTGDFTETTTECPIAGCDDVTSVRGDSLNDAVICVGTLVRAGKTLEARVSRDAGERVSVGCGVWGGGRAYRSARRYFWPSFSNSAMTQSEMQGMPGKRVQRQ